MKPVRAVLPLVAALLVGALALALRAQAVAQLPIDYDEDDYMRAAQQYATALQRGGAREIAQALTTQNYRPEHPQLMKLVLALPLAGLPPIDEIPDRDTSTPPAQIDPYLPRTHLEPVRWLAATLAVLGVFALALLDPLAGAALAVHSYHVKYGAQVMLESLPALTALLCVMAFPTPLRAGRRLWLSALLLGLTAAGKYLYAVAGIALMLHALMHEIASARKLRPQPLFALALWGGLALATFVAVQPWLWPDVIGRLRDSLLFHQGFAQGEQVQRAGLPWYQPLNYLIATLPAMNMAPARAFGVLLDPLLTVLALAGLSRAWRTRRVYVIWFVVGLGFLLVWNTKWPQYMMTLSAPLGVLAACGARVALLEPLQRTWQTRPSWHRPDLRRAWRELRTAAPWLLPGALALTLLVGFPLIYQLLMAVTDVNARALREVMSGAVFDRAVGGLFGAFPANVQVDVLRGSRSPTVNYAGGDLLRGLFTFSVGSLNAVLAINIIWMLMSTACQTALGVAVGLLLARREVRSAWIWRVLFILPWAVPEFVGALAWENLFNEDGGLIAGLIGAPFAWRDSPLLTLVVMLVAAGWMGFPMIMLATDAALRLIPREAAEAAQLDGAGRAQLFRHVTLPLISPLIAPFVMLRAIGAFNQFYLFDALRPRGLTTLSVLSYQLFDPAGRFGGQFNVSAAVNLLNAVVMLGLLLIFLRRTRGLDGVTYA